MNNRKRVTIVGVVAGAVLLPATLSAVRGNNVPVRAARAVRQPITNTISTNGKVEPVDNFQAHAPVATTVRKLLVREGDRVKAGQLLLQLDDKDARAEAARALARLRAAEAQLNAVKTGGTNEEVLTTRSALVKARGELDAARRNLEAVRRLEQRGAASAAEVTAAENRVKTAQAEVNLLEQKQTARYSRPEVARFQAEFEEAQAAYQAAQEVIAAANVTSPREGTVYSLPVRQGGYVNPGDLLVQVADLTRMQVRAFVDEPEIGRLERGQEVSVTWDALPGRTWKGTVARVPSTVVMHGTRTVGEVTCDLPNQDLKLLPNTNVNVLITTASHANALVVPREAIHEENGKRFIFEIAGGELHRREVETSISDLTSIEVTRGLQENAQVALGSVRGETLKPGMDVQVVQQ